jgi:hypothetical protein
VDTITASREAHVHMPWRACVLQLADILTADERSGERAHLIGRTHVHFVVAVQRIDVARDAMRFGVIADSPDFLHPVTGFVEAWPDSGASTTLRVSLVAALDEEALCYHVRVREAIASLAETLTSKIATAACA